MGHRGGHFSNLTDDDDDDSDYFKEVQVEAPPVLSWTIAASLVVDLIATPLVWCWALAFDDVAMRKQVTEYSFATSSFELLPLCAARVLLAAVAWGRARSSLVRVRADGSLKTSGPVAPALALCWGCALYATFKLGFVLASADAGAAGWAAAAVTAGVAAVEALALGRLRRAVRAVTQRSVYEKLRADTDATDGLDSLEGGSSDGNGGRKRKKLSYRQLLKVLKPYFWPRGTSPQAIMNKVRSTATWVLVLASKVCSVIAPLYLSDATNALYAQDVAACVRGVVTYAVLSFASKAFKEGQSLVYLKVKQQAYIEIAEQTFRHLHNLSLQWHLDKKMGNVIRSMDRGTDAANNLVTYLFLYLVPAVGECLATVILFYVKFRDWKLATMAFFALSLYGYVTVKLTLWRKKYRTETNKQDNLMHERATDSIVGYETVKYFTNEEYETERFCDAVKQYQKFSVSTQASLSVLNILQQLIMYCTLVAALSFAALSVGSGDYSVGDFVAVNVYMVQLFAPLNFLGSVYNVVIQAFVDIRNLSELLAESPDIIDDPGAAPLPLPHAGSGSGVSVEFRDVRFHYPTQPVNRGLRGVSFVVPPGTTTALVGHTGAGKTTISRLLFRFYDAAGGAVLLNGHDVRHVQQRSVRQAIGIVPQDTVLFNDTILHNVRYGRMSATMAEVEAAAEAAQIKSFIESLPAGWETPVGERGLKLSGGEKQRVAIARCLLKDPPVVLLDEATSALDNRTEMSVQEALNGLKKNRTTLVIAHRLSTVRGADQIIVLQEGQVLERGTHDELMATQGEYHHMWQIQVQEKRRMEEEEAASRSASAAVEGGEEGADTTAATAGGEERKEGGNGGGPFGWGKQQPKR